MGKLKLFETALSIVTLCLFVVAVAHGQSDIRSETLLRSSSAWDSVPYKEYSRGVPELSVLKITIPPHTTMKWHSHPMPNAAYVVSGEITVEELGGKRKRHFLAGQVVPETVNTLHRGVTGDRAVVLIVFYAGVRGIPLATKY